VVGYGGGAAWLQRLVFSGCPLIAPSFYGLSFLSLRGNRQQTDDGLQLYSPVIPEPTSEENR